MCMPAWRPKDETEAVGAEAVLLEWLAAVHGLALSGPAALRGWACADRPAFQAAFAAFAGLPAEDAELLEAAAGWLLGAGLRPDDRVLWTGPPDDPCLRGLESTGARRATGEAGATRRLHRAPVWPPAGTA